MAEEQELVDELFVAALARPLQQRAAFVKNACPESSSVQERVLELLRADEQAGSFLQGSAFLRILRSALPTSTEPPIPAGAGTPGRPEPRPTFEAGAEVAGRFQINRFIVRGGMGEVYEAWDSELKERVALKTIRHELAANPEMLDRFRQEVREARAISHPNVCRVHELFCHEVPDPPRKIWLLSMEFLDGYTLTDYLRHHGTLSPSASLELLVQIVNGLSAAHKVGIVHRDFKTANVMLVNAGTGSLRAVVTDFGLALNVLRPNHDLQESPGQGTPAYMAPEQRRSGKITSATDQYALGIVMCEMLTGSRPNMQPNIDESAAFLASHRIPERWKVVIRRCLDPKPENRFRSVEDVLLGLATPERSWKVWVLSAVAASGLLTAVVWHQLPAHLQPTSLAVLPFRYDSGSPKLDYVTTGITEALTNDLSRMPGLTTTAAGITRRVGADADPRDAGHRLHVGSVVTGSLTGPSEHLRIPVELIDVGTGQQRWGKTYEGSSSELPELQHQISTDIAFSLKIGLSSDTQARLARQYATNGLAYEDYLKGRFNLAKRTGPALQEAIASFQRALDRDPKYAPALAGLADCYSLLGYYGVQDPMPSFRKALDAADQALELDSTLSDAYAARALARTFLSFEWKGAEEDYRRSIALNPSDLTAHNWYAVMLLVPLRRQSEAAAQATYMRAADAQSLVTVASTATMDYFAGDFDKTIRSLEPRVQEFREFEPFVELLGLAYLAKGENDKAIRLLAMDPSASGARAVERAGRIGIAFARTGQRRKAEQQLELLKAAIQNGGSFSYNTASLYLALGDRRRAMDMLELAYTQRESSVIFVNVDPLLAPLRSEPRFATLLGQMNLE